MVGGTVPIESVETDKTQPVFNLNVAENRDFFVGKTGLLVHDFSFVQPVVYPFDRQPELGLAGSCPRLFSIPAQPQLNRLPHPVSNALGHGVDLLGGELAVVVGVETAELFLEAIGDREAVGSHPVRKPRIRLATGRSFGSPASPPINAAPGGCRASR